MAAVTLRFTESALVTQKTRLVVYDNDSEPIDRVYRQKRGTRDGLPGTVIKASAAILRQGSHLIGAIYYAGGPLSFQTLPERSVASFSLSRRNPLRG